MIGRAQWESAGRRGGIRLDPRTKLLVILVVSWTLLTFSGISWPPAVVARWALIALPGLLLAAAGLIVAALRYLASYALLGGLPLLAWSLAPGEWAALDLFLVWFGGLSLILPGTACAYYTLRTTTASEFIAAMQRLHCPDAVTIPAAIVFRFFPTVGEEYRDIRMAMRMRGIGGLRQPMRMLEYRLVPLLVSVVGIGNELSMSAVTRALGSARRRTSISTIGFGWPDAIVTLTLLLLAGVIVAGRIGAP